MGEIDWKEYTNVDIIAQTLARIDIDIIAQSISELQSRPKYGTANTSSYSGNPTGNTETSLISIGGTGVIYGGYVYCTDTQEHDLDNLVIKVDNTEIFRFNTLTMMERGLTQPYGHYAFVSKQRRSSLNYDYCFILTPNITFEISYELIWDNNKTDSTLVKAILIYATI